MNFSLIYLINRAVYRIGDFFHHWYVDGSRRIIHSFVSRLEELDKSFAFRVTLQHFFEPLYKDYSFIGRILGIPFRAGRLVVGGITYLVISIVYLIVFAVWVSIPAAIIGYAIVNL